MSQPSDAWNQYALALLESMAEVLDEIPEEAHPSLLEAADYWLSIGLVIGTLRPADASRLLAIIEAHGVEAAELERDAADLCTEVFR